MEIKRNIAYYKKFDSIHFEVKSIVEFKQFEYSVYLNNTERISTFQNIFKPSFVYQKNPEAFLIISSRDGRIWDYDLRNNILKFNPHFENKDSCLFGDLIDSEKLLISDPADDYKKVEYVNLIKGEKKWIVERAGMQIKFNNVFTNNINDKKLSLINKADGSIKWQFDFAKYIVFDLTKNPFNESTRFDLIALIKNELICIANSDRFLSIDINTGELLWELTECVYEDGNEKMNVSSIYEFGVEGNILYTLQGNIYKELDILKKQCIVKKDFAKNEDGDKQWFHRCTLYKGKFYFTADLNFKNSRWNQIGIFDITTREVIWQTTLKLPPGVILNQKPVVDDNHLYIKDSGNTLYIFEKNEDGSIKPTEFQVAGPTLVKQQPESATINIKKTVNPIEISKLSNTIQLMQNDGMDTAAITEFRNLAGTDDYINDDTENYWGIEHYESLLRGMAILAAPQINITVTDVLENKRKWIFNFTINNHPKSITMNNPNTDNLEDQFIEDMNQLTNEFCNTHTFIFAYPESIDEADQWFHLFYLSNEAIGKLQQSSYSYFD